jgi:carbon monoxide dehydrogenase subunit G
VRLENSFSVPASPEQVWELLNDVPRVVPNMPGARLDEVVDENAWKATMSVKLGAVALEFAADVRREVVDAQTRTTKLAVKAREVKNRGGATATIESTLEPDGTGTTVTIVTDLHMHGAVAQYGRAVVPDVAGQMVGQFAANLAASLG